MEMDPNLVNYAKQELKAMAEIREDLGPEELAEVYFRLDNLTGELMVLSKLADSLSAPDVEDLETAAKTAEDRLTNLAQSGKYSSQVAQFLFDTVSRLSTFSTQLGYYLHVRRVAVAATETRLQDDQGFYTKDGLEKLLFDSGTLKYDEFIYDELLLFQTKKQHTWLISTNRRLYCLLDDEKTREGRRVIQWNQPLSAAGAKSAYLSLTKKGVIDLGRKRPWLYSRSLHSNPDQLVEKVQALVSGGLEIQRELSRSGEKRKVLRFCIEDQWVRKEYGKAPKRIYLAASFDSWLDASEGKVQENPRWKLGYQEQTRTWEIEEDLDRTKRHQYKFVIFFEAPGINEAPQWTTDPNNPRKDTDPQGNLNSIIPRNYSGPLAIGSPG